MELVPSFSAFISLVAYLIHFLNYFTFFGVGLYTLFSRLLMMGIATAIAYALVSNVKSQSVEG